MSGSKRYARTSSTASPYVMHELVMGAFPPSGTRLPGWVERHVTRGTDNVPYDELVTRYGEMIRTECLASGFQPAFDVPLDEQSPESQAAAEAWAARWLHTHAY